MSGPNEKAAEGQTWAALDTTQNTQAHPTQGYVPMQACRELFAELEVDNFKEAVRLSGEIIDIADQREKLQRRLEILQRQLMYMKFSAGKKKLIVGGMIRHANCHGCFHLGDYEGELVCYDYVSWPNGSVPESPPCFRSTATDLADRVISRARGN